MNELPQVVQTTQKRPGIFYSRVGGSETYYSATPMIYSNNNGYVRKILLSKEAERQFFDDTFMLVDSCGNVLDKSKLKGVKIDEGDYTYYNFLDNIMYINEYMLGDPIYFYTDAYNANLYVPKGISVKENWGSWTNGHKVILRMLISNKSPILSAHIDVGNTFYQPQHVIIYINETETYRGTIEGDQDIDFVFEAPSSDLIEMTIMLPDAVSPAEIMGSTDTRVLGLGLLSMQIEGN